MVVKPRTLERESVCDRHGPYLESGGSLTGRDKDSIWFGCPECKQYRVELDRAEVEAKAKAEALRHHEAKLKVAGIPIAYRGRGFDDYIARTPEQNNALMVARSFADEFWTKHLPEGRFLVFYGSPGTGKTHLALAIAKHVLQQGNALYLDAMDLIRKVRITWRKDSVVTEEQVLKLFGFTIDLLVIDEVGVQRGTETEQIILFDVINRRYRDLRPTIFLTNARGQALRDYIGVRTIDRMVERSIVVPFQWDSYRIYKG